MAGAAPCWGGGPLVKALPAIDLRDGACVQLVGGSYDAERIRIADPMVALARWRACGFSELHLVDLDAALGRGDNERVLTRLLSTAGCTFSVGGGVRSEERIAQLLALGAARVVVGTRALDDPPWLEAMAARFPGRLVLAADVRGRQVLTRGWAQGTGRPLQAVLSGVAGLPLAGVLVTAVHREGQEQGIDLPLFQEASSGSALPLYASGGVTTLEDLRALRAVGARGAVIGMALYTGRLDATLVAREFA